MRQGYGVGEAEMLAAEDVAPAPKAEPKPEPVKHAPKPEPVKSAPSKTFSCSSTKSFCCTSS